MPGFPRPPTSRPSRSRTPEGSGRRRRKRAFRLPRDIRAKRVRVHRGKVAFDRSRSRGSKVTGYTVKCVARTGKDVESARGSDSPIVVRGLAAGVAYDCKVGARSKAGPSRWSAADRMPARP